MKKVLLVAFLAFACNAKSQIVLLHIYDSASTYNIFGPYAEMNQLMMIKFETSGERYVKVNRWGKTISIYDMNHALQKTISCSAFPTNVNGQMGDFIYFSEKLFDTDSALEFMYIWGNNLTNAFGTNIYKENGTIIFSDTGAARIRGNFEQQQYPIYNTSQGTIMILSYKNGQDKVFGLPGTLSTGIQEGNSQLIQMQEGALINLYPNPGYGAVTLQYELPKGEKEGWVILYNTQGEEVKRYKVDGTFNDILLDNSQLPAGTYFYQLTTNKGAAGSKKMVVVK